MKKSKFFQPPLLELVIMLSVLLLSYIGLAVIAFLAQDPVAGEMSHSAIVFWLSAFFLVSFGIAVLSVIAGISGGVIFTPLMMAFTPVDSVLIRGTGLIVAMFSGLISTGIFMKKGLGHFKMCVTLTMSQGLGALFGAHAAIYAAIAFADTGEGVIRIILGCILVSVSAYFFVGGKKLEWPNIQKVDTVTKWMRLEHTYYEESDKKTHTYKITRILLGLVLLFGIGFLGGFFGMGAGWALTPVQNLGLGVPLKAATANSGIILGMVDCVAVWPYMLAGGIIPLFVVPWLSGQVVGGYLGAFALVKAKVTIIRYILIGIMLFSSFVLITDGFARLGLMARVPGEISLAVFLVIMVVDIVVIVRMQKKSQREREDGQTAT